jgi:hypothetical protein
MKEKGRLLVITLIVLAISMIPVATALAEGARGGG